MIAWLLVICILILASRKTMAWLGNKIHHAYFFFIPVRKNGRLLPLKVIKKTLKVKLGLKLKKINRQKTPHHNPQRKKIRHWQYDKFNLSWYVILAHEVGHAACKHMPGNLDKINVRIYAFLLQTSDGIKTLGLLNIILCLLDINWKFMVIPQIMFLICCVNIITKEVQASNFGYKLLCKTYLLTKSQKLFMIKFYSFALLTYLILILNYIIMILVSYYQF